MRTVEQTCAAIADASERERADIHRRVEAMTLSEDQKHYLHRFIMLLGLVGDAFPTNGKIKLPH